EGELVMRWVSSAERRADIRSRVASACGVAALVLFLPAAIRAAEPSSGPEEATDPAEQARRYVEQLGDEQFAVRERAVSRLIELGLPALPVLEQSRRNPDREIRYRSERVLVIIRQNDFQRR